MRTTTATKPPDHLERLGADLERAAHSRIARLQRRRRRIQAGVVVALAAALMTGIGLAASGVDVLGLIRSDDPGNARFQVDRNAVYHGPAPQRLACASVGGASFTCAVGSRPAPRVYTFLDRVERPQQAIFARDTLLRRLDRAERKGLVHHGEAARFRRDIAAVGDDFFSAMQALPLTEGIGASVGTSEKGEIVPPPGVPMLIYCDDVAADEATCHPLSGAVGVPARAPFYELEPTRDWVPFKAPPSELSTDFGWQLELLLGRPVSDAELRLIVDLATATGSTGASGSRVETTQSGTLPAEPSGSSDSGGSGSSSGGFSSP